MDEFYIKIVSIEDQPDGGAIVTMDLNEPARNFFIEQGFNAVMKEAVKNTLEGSDDEKGACCGACRSDVGC